MRRLLITLMVVTLAGCTRPAAPGPQTPAPPTTDQHRHGPIIGLTSDDLVRQLGTPALQIREGNSLKLQFRSHFCVLDAYLYPPPGGVAPYRVTYIDTRARSLADVDRDACLHSFEGP